MSAVDTPLNQPQAYFVMPCIQLVKSYLDRLLSRFCE
uniref:Uncharacterized protein n=1 Tax=Rhizophora mucronata TaxID=61149 RepID=A0A2P2J5R0_RHIMU